MTGNRYQEKPNLLFHRETMLRTRPLQMLFLLFAVHPPGVTGHGFLRHPPGRSSMWLFGYNTPPNYQHMEMFCGGFPIQWWINDGKCGVCGDPFDASRENEPPRGKYARGIITQTYTAGSIITAIVHVTASHKGYFEFRLCPHNDPKVTVTQDCLDRILLNDPFTMGTKFFVDDKSVGIYNIELQLPEGVICDACVLQWRYRTGNRWGCYNNDFTKGPCGLGFGPQEEFYACSDIQIIGNGSTNLTTASSSDSTSTSHPTTKLTTASPKSATSTVTSPGSSVTTSAKISTSQTSPTTSAKISTSQTIPTTSTKISTSQTGPTTSAKISTSQTSPTTSAKISTSQTGPTTSAKISTSQKSPTTSAKVSNFVMTSSTTPRPQIATSPIPTVRNVCKAVGPWKNFLPMDNWCRINCARNYCPPTHCLCGREDLLTVDNGIMNSGKTCVSLRPNSGWDLWCQHNCPMGLCYPSMCRCDRIAVSKMVQHNLGR